MDLASVVAALASVGVRVSGSTPNNNIQGDSSRACPTGLAGPEPSGTLNDPGQHFHCVAFRYSVFCILCNSCIPRLLAWKNLQPQMTDAGLSSEEQRVNEAKVKCRHTL